MADQKIVMECNLCGGTDKYFFDEFLVKQKKLKKEKATRFPCPFGCEGKDAYMGVKETVWE